MVEGYAYLPKIKDIGFMINRLLNKKLKNKCLYTIKIVVNGFGTYAN